MVDDISVDEALSNHYSNAHLQVEDDHHSYMVDDGDDDDDGNEHRDDNAVVDIDDEVVQDDIHYHVEVVETLQLVVLHESGVYYELLLFVHQQQLDRARERLSLDCCYCHVTL